MIWRRMGIEYVLAEPSSHPPHLAEQRIEVRVIDQGGGPYLRVRGIDDDAADDPDHKADALYLGSHDAIDALAVQLHKILAQAEAAAGETKP